MKTVGSICAAALAIALFVTGSGVVAIRSLGLEQSFSQGLGWSPRSPTVHS